MRDPSGVVWFTRFVAYLYRMLMMIIALSELRWLWTTILSSALIIFALAKVEVVGAADIPLLTTGPGTVRNTSGTS